jgi:hypothetical protein
MIALRKLDADPGIPVEFNLALRPALVERSSESTPFRYDGLDDNRRD